jgi:hypothetical protein
MDEAGLDHDLDLIQSSHPGEEGLDVFRRNRSPELQ